MDTNPVVRVALPIARFFVLICGWWLLGFAILTCVDIVGRKWFGLTLQGTDEIGGYTMAVISSVGFSYALLQRTHTRIDIVLTHLKRRNQAVLNMVAAMMMAAMAIYGALSGWDVLRETIELKSVSNSPLQIPLWIPQGLWLIGLVLFAGIAFATAIHALRLLSTRYGEVNRSYGPPSVAEEIESAGVDKKTLQALQVPA